ncbi:MAG: hypothetical protein HY288_07420 [Planctomycetia bacterium]|nr:hypothetical protein [Planctomycetia bacterium]
MLLAFLSVNSRLGENPRDASGLRVEYGVTAELPLDSCGSCASTTAECLVASSNAANFLGCFFAGTVVATEVGPKRIESVVADERVWSCDLTTGRWRLCPVVETYEAEYVGDLIEVTVEGKRIESTYHHPFWVVEGQHLDERPRPDHVERAAEPSAIVAGRWVDAGDLQIGDVLLLKADRRVPVEALDVRQVVQTVYNFHVHDLHNYAVGPDHVLVHNNSPCAQVVENGIRGRASQARVLEQLGLQRNTLIVSTLEGNAIPDALTNAISLEVKDAIRVSLTRQLRIQTEAALAAGRQSILITGPNSRVSAAVQLAFDDIIRLTGLGP